MKQGLPQQVLITRNLIQLDVPCAGYSYSFNRYLAGKTFCITAWTSDKVPHFITYRNHAPTVRKGLHIFFEKTCVIFFE